MNFLSHYYFDRVENNEYFNLGLIFPDIARNFVKGTRLNLNIEVPEDYREAQLLKGCIQHVQSDKIFHAWDGFHHAMDFVTQRIRSSKHDIRKDWFIAHILVELTIDHHLLLVNPNLASKLYTDFEKVETEVLTSFLGKHDFSNFDSFLSGYNRFMNARYLESYNKRENIVYALGKICNKMRLEPFSDGQKELLSNIVTDLVRTMPERVVELDIELKWWWKK